MCDDGINDVFNKICIYGFYIRYVLIIVLIVSRLLVVFVVLYKNESYLVFNIWSC